MRCGEIQQHSWRMCCFVAEKRGEEGWGSGNYDGRSSLNWSQEDDASRAKERKDRT